MLLCGELPLNGHLLELGILLASNAEAKGKGKTSFLFEGFRVDAENAKHRVVVKDLLNFEKEMFV